MSADGSALLYSTYLGGSGDDHGWGGIAVDSAGNAYLTGRTASRDFPLVNPLQPTHGGGDTCGSLPCPDAFVTKINANGSALIYSTYLGGNHDDQGLGIAVDTEGNAYVTGSTLSTNFPLANPLQPTYGGSYDAFVVKVSASGMAFFYSTYLGGRSADFGRAIAADSAGNAYVAGYTTSPNFPLASPLQPTYGGGLWDAFVSRVVGLNTDPVR